MTRTAMDPRPGDVVEWHSQSTTCRRYVTRTAVVHSLIYYSLQGPDGPERYMKPTTLKSWRQWVQVRGVRLRPVRGRNAA
jgi:hypothetical protein